MGGVGTIFWHVPAGFCWRGSFDGASQKLRCASKHTLAARGLEELRVNLLLKENSYVSYIILHQSLILELKSYKLYVLICIMFSSLDKRTLL